MRRSRVRERTIAESSRRLREVFGASVDSPTVQLWPAPRRTITVHHDGQEGGEPCTWTVQPFWAPASDIPEGGPVHVRRPCLPDLAALDLVIGCTVTWSGYRAGGAAVSCTRRLARAVLRSYPGLFVEVWEGIKEFTLSGAAR